MSDSLITKRALAKSLKELCQYRNFEKISINDLTSKCSLNRQTFYYHFQDKYDLLQWLYYDELFIDIENIITFNNWDQCLLKVLKKYIKKKIFILVLLILMNNTSTKISIIYPKNVFMMQLPNLIQTTLFQFKKKIFLVNFMLMEFLELFCNG